ncbi:MAG: alkaline phosphatase D family protein [Acidimicrobiales bacterium]
MHPISRRAFIVGAVAAGAVACGGQSSGPGRQDVGASTAVRTAAPPPPLPRSPFSLGVASGDPLPDSVVLWTRLAPDPLRGGGMPSTDVDVEWEVAEDETFADVVAAGVATAEPRYGHALHVEVSELDPDRWYAYRFRVGEHTSPVGRTRTAPADDTSPERFRIAVANCQDLQGGYYLAHRDIAAQDFDAVLFLGDYIYEVPGVDDPEQALAERRYLGSRFPETLDDYRARYARARLDPDLQAAHAACPWIVTFDDHEVINNYAGRDGALGGKGPAFAARRAAAYQAWWEHMPIRTPPPETDSVRVHRDLRWGDLAHLFVIETRQDADPPPCRETSNFDQGPGCPERLEPARSALGAEQREWLFNGLTSSTATWTLLGNPVLLAGLDVSDPGEPPEYFLEVWDGYPVERRALVEHLADERVPSPVVLTGDYHAAFVNLVKPDPWDPDSPVAAPELLATSVSSGLYVHDYRAKNPQVLWFDGQHHGYLDAEVGRERIVARFRGVGDVKDPSSPVTTVATFEITSGKPPQVRQI